MRVDCVSPIRLLCGIYKSAPRWRKSANDGSKTSCALLHRSRGLVSVSFHGIKKKKKKKGVKKIEESAGPRGLACRIQKVVGAKLRRSVSVVRLPHPFIFPWAIFLFLFSSLFFSISSLFNSKF